MTLTLTIEQPQHRHTRQRGVYATTSGTTLKVRLSSDGHRNVQEAASQLGMTLGEFMRQVVENAAREVCNDKALRQHREGDSSL